MLMIISILTWLRCISRPRFSSYRSCASSFGMGSSIPDLCFQSFLCKFFRSVAAGLGSPTWLRGWVGVSAAVSHCSPRSPHFKVGTVHRQREVHPRNPAFPPAARDGRFRVCACGCVPGFASGGLSSQCSLFGLWPRRSLCVLWFSALLSCSPFGSLRRLSFPWLCVSSSNTSLWCGLVSFPGSLGLLRFGGGLFFAASPSSRSLQI